MNKKEKKVFDEIVNDFYQKRYKMTFMDSPYRITLEELYKCWVKYIEEVKK